MEVWPASVTVAGSGLTRASGWRSLESERAGHVLRPFSADRSGARTLVLLGDAIFAVVVGVPLSTSTPWDRGVGSAVGSRPFSR